ncbi:MAG: c-type cytochrome [Anaeromyxobacteraceae bacterium]
MLAAAPAARAAPAGSPWNAAYFGNTVLVTQDGKPVKLHDDLLAGRRVVIAFVDPRCDGECGLVTANLVRIRRLLGDRVGRDLFFYTVSVDPRATPESLRAYAAAYKADWTFLAGSEADLLTVRGKFGDHAPLDVHSPRIAVGNETTGEWMTQGGLDNPAYLAGVLGNWLDPAWATRRDAVRSYAEAPAIAKPTQGELLWRQKCAACHAPGGKSVGPSLAGVTERRARGWLVRFIADPKGLARSGDPDARALAAAYQAAPMPKLGLGEEEADAVVSYLEHGAGRP